MCGLTREQNSLIIFSMVDLPVPMSPQMLNINHLSRTRPYHAKSFGNLMRFFTKNSFYHQGFFAVKRRAVFILGATWEALVRGWWRDCVVGGMETRFQ